MAAAAFMIRDGDIPGRNITILEELDKIGGSLDGSGNPATGYVLRGGRMIESKYVCTYELFSSIPHARRIEDGHAGDIRLERDDEDLVEIPADFTGLHR
jgi:myosin-crossreactive antigen